MNSQPQAHFGYALAGRTRAHPFVLLHVPASRGVAITPRPASAARALPSGANELFPRSERGCRRRRCFRCLGTHGVPRTILSTLLSCSRGRSRPPPAMRRWRHGRGASRIVCAARNDVAGWPTLGRGDIVVVAVTRRWCKIWPNFGRPKLHGLSPPGTVLWRGRRGA